MDFVAKHGISSLRNSLEDMKQGENAERLAFSRPFTSYQFKMRRSGTLEK
jgi:hypothetical protein